MRVERHRLTTLIGHYKLLNQIDLDGSVADADARPVTQDAWAYVTERISAAPDPAEPPDAVLLSLHGTMVTEIDGSLLRNHVLPWIGTHRRGELQPSDFLDIQARLLEAGKAPRIAERVLVLWRYVCNCAIRWKTPRIKTNPTAEAGVPSSAKRSGALSSESHVVRPKRCRGDPLGGAPGETRIDLILRRVWGSRCRAHNHKILWL